MQKIELLADLGKFSSLSLHLSAERPKRVNFGAERANFWLDKAD